MLSPRAPATHRDRADAPAPAARRVPAARALLPRTALAALLLAPACTPTHSTMQPYRDDPALQADLAARAEQWCRQARSGAGMPPHPFTTDGCSAARDGSWRQCCVEHDIAYWCGGDAADRKAADAELRRCVQESGRSASFARLVHATVRVGGAPWLPTSWRWAYGWSGIHGYDRRSHRGSR